MERKQCVISPTGTLIILVLVILGWCGIGMFIYWYQYFGPNYLEPAAYKTFSATGMAIILGGLWPICVLLMVGLICSEYKR